MTFQRIVLAAMIAALVGTEIARPTVFIPKHVAYGGTSRFAVPELDQLELDDLPPIVQPALGNIDVASVIINDRMRPFVQDEDIPRGATIRLVGWCADPQTRARGAKLIAILDGKIRENETAGYLVPRPDVAKALVSAAALSTGYRIDIPTEPLRIGPNQLQIAVLTTDSLAIAVFPVALRFSVVARSPPSRLRPGSRSARE